MQWVVASFSCEPNVDPADTLKSSVLTNRYSPTKYIYIRICSVTVWSICILNFSLWAMGSCMNTFAASIIKVWGIYIERYFFLCALLTGLKWAGLSCERWCHILLCTNLDFIRRGCLISVLPELLIKSDVTPTQSWRSRLADITFLIPKVVFLCCCCFTSSLIVSFVVMDITRIQDWQRKCSQYFPIGTC